MLNISYLQTGGVSRKGAKESKERKEILIEANFKRQRERIIWYS